MLIKTKEKRRPVAVLTAAQEAVLDRRMEEKFRSQRETPNGRNFLWNTFRFKDERALENFRRNYARINWKAK